MPQAVTPFHLVMTADTVGGVWRHVADLAAGLAAAGVRVTVLTVGPPAAPDQRAEIAAMPGVALEDTGLPLDWTAESAAELRLAGRALAALARERGADLVQLHAAALAAGGGFDGPLVAVQHSCVATWWDAMRKEELPADFRWRTDLAAEGLAAADAVVAPSRSFAADVARRYGLARPPEVIHNGTAPAPPATAGRARFALTAGRLWDEAKGAAVLDEAAAGLDLPVRAAGALEGPGGAAFRPRHLEPLGRLDAAAMRRVLGEAGLFVSLARYEPFGLGVLEAAAAGCPLLLADIATFRELWQGAARFVDPRDPGAVRDAIATLDADLAERARLSAAARGRASRYPLAASVRAFHDLHRRLLAADARPPVLVSA